MNEPFGDTSKNWRQLRPAQKVAVTIVVAAAILPPTIVKLFDLPPALWLKAQESKVFGGYYLPKLTWVLLTFANTIIFLFVAGIINITIKFLTGKPLLQLFGKQNAEAGVVQLGNISHLCGNIYADIYVCQAWLDEGKNVSLSLPDGRFISLQLNSSMSAESTLCLKNQSQGGDLHLRIKISN